MSSEFQSSQPIYMQIVDRIIIDILQEKQSLGGKMPSVREMAIKMGVNPNTIQRAYSELERMDIVETRRGQGTFVLENDDLLDQLRDSMQKEFIENYVQKMKEIGASNQQMISQLKRYLKEDE
ncbi:GntR family transcriptional regulator [Aquibacillus rhizosphaerae]|uniref:GntR family transcriptional regulator n=1 Tax=Aquibacillus rhizosphaerae TaxID=3051431 RepID=A0ABT7L1P7_9BACI|nr:GntR family transcriptional regulator [Aquibacillus sp. LR5S19]MDL4839743.1 GntR family transcriptional regulator [Aquibacillus sp. LR5S19]